MSGVRQTQQAVCVGCGTTGVVELGMLVVGAASHSRSFDCPNCGEAFTVESNRHILDLKWQTTGAVGAKP